MPVKLLSSHFNSDSENALCFMLRRIYISKNITIITNEHPRK